MDAMAHTPAGQRHLTVADAAREGLTVADAAREGLTVADAAREGMARARADDAPGNGDAPGDGDAPGGEVPPARDAARRGDAASRDAARQARARAGAAELRHRRVRLAREPAAAALARGEVRAALAAWGTGVDVDLAVLLTSDLVTNAILRGEGATITLAVRCKDGRVRVDVYDTWRALPVVLDTGASSAAGPGLSLIAAMASEWGTYRIPSGMAVYFSLASESSEPDEPGLELPRGGGGPRAPGITRGDGGL